MRSICTRGLTFAVLTLLLVVPIPVQAEAHTQTEIYVEDFEDGEAQDWQLEPGWQVMQDEGNFVLSGEGHAWSRADKSYDNYRLSFRIKLLKGGVHLNYRMNDTGRYFIGFNTGNSYLNKQYWPDTFQNDLARGKRGHSENQWAQIEIIGEGDTLTFIVDGNTEWTYTDPEPLLVGSFAFETLDNSQIYIDDIKVELSPTSDFIPDESLSSLTWVRTGGPLGGLGYDIRMMPDNPDSMLVSDAWAGVFASTNGGGEWQPSNNGITVRTGSTGDAIPIFCLTIDQSNPNIVWVGTQNTRGIFKSTDGGVTWERKDEGVVEVEGITFRGIAVDPTDSDVVYAAAEISSWVWNNGQPSQGREFDMVGGVVYKTTDGGEHWAESWRGNNLARYVWIDPRDTNVLYLSTGIFDREAANSNPKTGDPGGEGILKSTDGGVTWEQINNGLNNLYVGSLFMNQANPDILLAGTGNVQYHANGGVYLSTDGGMNWKQVLRDQIIESVEFSSSDPNIAYAGSSDAIFRSEDGGENWDLVSGGGPDGWGAPGVRAGFPIDFQVDPRDPNRIFANEYGGGNFLSEDGGKTWVDASRGYTGAQVRAIAVDPTQPGRVIAAARSGIFASYDGGANWLGLSNHPVVSMEWSAVAIDPTDHLHVIAETNWDNRLVNSTNDGRTWNDVLHINDERVAFHAIAFAPSDPATVYAGSSGYYSAGSFDLSQPGKGIYVSQDGGNKWVPANDSLTQDAHVVWLAVDSQDPQVVYAATSNHGLLKTNDGGASWQKISEQESAISVAVHPTKPNIVFAGFARQAIYVSMDGGQTWEQSAKGMSPESQITSIVFDPTKPDEIIYAADNFSGVYRSSNAGKSWSMINTGLTTRAINGLAISSDGLHLYAASEGGGVFRLDLAGQPPASVPQPTSVPASTAAVPPPVASTSTPTPTPSTGLPCTGALIIPLLFGLIFWLGNRFR